MSVEQQFAQERQSMVNSQIIARGIKDPLLLAALLEVPRHVFIPTEYRNMAYTDGPLPIGQGQTISQPYIVALMTEMLKLKGHETVLEVGTGSGYQAAVLAKLADTVHSIERHKDLAELAMRNLHRLDITNIHVHVGDGSLGLPEYSPYDAIIVTAAAPQVPEPLLEQLAPTGRLVIPVGMSGAQDLQCWWRDGDDFDYQSVLPVAFVPLRGEHGWKEERWKWS